MPQRLEDARRLMPASMARAVTVAIRNWKTAHGREPRFVVVAHGTYEAGTTGLFSPTTTITAIDADPGEQESTWTIEVTRS
jgi:hypothetical protein